MSVALGYSHCIFSNYLFMLTKEYPSNWSYSIYFLNTDIFQKTRKIPKICKSEKGNKWNGYFNRAFFLPLNPKRPPESSEYFNAEPPLFMITSEFFAPLEKKSIRIFRD